MKSIFEQNGGTYTRCGDCLLPDMGLTELEKKPLGKYGMMRRRYLEESRQGLYTRMIHLQEIDATCSRRMEQMIREMAVAEGVTEELKAKEQMSWVRKMNSLHAAAEEIVLKELVYA